MKMLLITLTLVLLIFLEVGFCYGEAPIIRDAYGEYSPKRDAIVIGAVETRSTYGNSGDCFLCNFFLNKLSIGCVSGTVPDEKNFSRYSLFGPYGPGEDYKKYFYLIVTPPEIESWRTLEMDVGCDCSIAVDLSQRRRWLPDRQDLRPLCTFSVNAGEFVNLGTILVKITGSSMSSFSYSIREKTLGDTDVLETFLLSHGDIAQKYIEFAKSKIEDENESID